MLSCVGMLGVKRFSMDISDDMTVDDFVDAACSMLEVDKSAKFIYAGRDLASVDRKSYVSAVGIWAKSTVHVVAQRA